MEMDWGDDEDNIYGTEKTKSSLHKEKSKLSEGEGTQSSLMSKYADIMAKPLTPQVKEKLQ